MSREYIVYDEILSFSNADWHATIRNYDLWLWSIVFAEKSESHFQQSSNYHQIAKTAHLTLFQVPVLHSVFGPINVGIPLILKRIL